MTRDVLQRRHRDGPFCRIRDAAVDRLAHQVFRRLVRRANRARPQPPRLPAVSGEGLALHRSSLVVDLHADTPHLIRFGFDVFAEHSPPLPRAALLGHLDIPRARQGGLDLQVMGLISSPRFDREPFDTVIRQLQAVQAAARRRPDALRCVPPGEPLGDALDSARRAGALAAMFCMEGAHPLEGRMDRLDALQEMGLRALGLAHFSANEAATPAWGLGRDDQAGLRPFGRDLVAHCNDRGVLLDLAHLNRPGLLEATALTRAPVMVSHTGVAGVHPHWRNLDGAQIRAVADTGGCVGVIFAPQYLGGKGLDAVVAHLEHVLQVGGEGCPALGSDFDGWITPPHDLRDVTDLPRLTDALLSRGHRPETIQKILGENARRVLASGRAAG